MAFPWGAIANVGSAIIGGLTGMFSSKSTNKSNEQS